MLASLPPDVREAYDLDQLLAADYRGRLVWVVRTVSGWLYGDVVGDLVADAILAGWSVVQPGPSDVWA